MAQRTLQEIQRLINEAYKNANNDYNQAAVWLNKSTGEDLNTLVRQRNAMRDNPQQYYNTITKISNTIRDADQKKQQTFQKPRYETTPKKETVPKPKTKYEFRQQPSVSYKQSFMQLLKDALYDVSDKATGWAYGRSERNMEKSVENMPEWDDSRFNEFMVGENSPIKGVFREHIKKRLPTNAKVVYVDKGAGQLGDEKALIWDAVKQEVKRFIPYGTSNPAIEQESDLSLADMKTNWLQMLRNGQLPSSGVGGTYKLVKSPYTWVLPGKDVDVERASAAYKYFVDSGIKNPEIAFRFENPDVQPDSLQTAWGVKVPPKMVLAQALHAADRRNITPGCTKFGCDSWDSLLELLLSSNNPYVAQYDEMMQ